MIGAERKILDGWFNGSFANHMAKLVLKIGFYIGEFARYVSQLPWFGEILGIQCGDLKFSSTEFASAFTF